MMLMTTTLVITEMMTRKRIISIYFFSSISLSLKPTSPWFAPAQDDVDDDDDEDDEDEDEDEEEDLLSV